MPAAPMTWPWVTLKPHCTKMALRCAYEGLETRAMIDHDHVAIAVAVRAGVDHHAAIGGVDVVAQFSGEIDAEVVALRGVIEAGQDSAGRSDTRTCPYPIAPPVTGAQAPEPPTCAEAGLSRVMPSGS